MSEQTLLDGRVILRPLLDGSFDELLVMDGEECRLHLEMMADNQLWIGIYPAGCGKERVVVNVGARGKLKIIAEED